MNVIFISPHFPTHFYRFCQRLKERGVTVLGIGDAPWEAIGESCQQSLSDYAYVPSLEHYEDVYRAVAGFISRYGRIDFVESENEYWLELDARIRTDFNICTGPKMNFAFDTDVYTIWADSLIHDRCFLSGTFRRYITHVGRKDGRRYLRTPEQARAALGGAILEEFDVPAALAAEMGSHAWLLQAETDAQRQAQIALLLEEEAQ